MSRFERIEAELKKQLALVLQSGVRDPRVKGLISVTRVSVDRELTYAKVYVSILGVDGLESEVIEGLNNAHGYIQAQLKKQIRLRAMPTLHFIYDESIVYASKMNKKITQISEGIKDNATI